MLGVFHQRCSGLAPVVSENNMGNGKHKPTINQNNQTHRQQTVIRLLLNYWAKFMHTFCSDLSWTMYHISPFKSDSYGLILPNFNLTYQHITVTWRVKIGVRVTL